MFPGIFLGPRSVKPLSSILPLSLSLPVYSCQRSAQPHRDGGGHCVLQFTARMAATPAPCRHVACHRATEEETSVEELKAYFGFMVLMGINQLPEIRDYWAKDPSFHYSPIADCIACDRFERSHATCTLLSMMFCLLVGMQLNHRGGQCYLRLGDPVQFYLRGSSTTSQADRRRGRGRRWGWM